MFQEFDDYLEESNYKGIKESLLKKLTGVIYLKESESYKCDECDEYLVKEGLTVHWNARDYVYKKTEVPFLIEDVAIFGVINLKL